jgi:hypothetical protein
MTRKDRLWLILCGLLVGFTIWSLPLLAQETPPTEPVFVLTVGSRSCTLATAPEEAVEAATETSAAPRPTYRPTLTPIPRTPSADATEEPADGFNTGDLVVLTLSEDCANLISQLQVPENGTLWLSLSLQDDPNVALPLSALVDDPYPPQLDRRGRFFGCEIAAQGEQVCRVVVTVGETSYQIDVPVVVEGAFVAPPAAAPTSAPAVQATNTAPPSPPPPPPQTTQNP